MEGSDSQIRLGDQHFVSTKLASIYGLDSNNDSVLVNLVNNQNVLFGGPCDLYLGDCANAGNTQLGVVPGMNAARGALTTRSCDMINSQDTNVTNAIANLGSSFSGTAAPTTAGIIAAYQAFHPGRTPGAAAVQTLQSVSDEAARQSTWRVRAMEICASHPLSCARLASSLSARRSTVAPDWQAPERETFNGCARLAGSGARIRPTKRIHGETLPKPSRIFLSTSDIAIVLQINPPSAPSSESSRKHSAQKSRQVLPPL